MEGIKDRYKMNCNLIESEYRNRYGVEYDNYRKEWNRPLKEIKNRDFPIHINFEINDICNLKCAFCIRSEDIQEKQGVPSINSGSAMSLFDFSEIMNEAKQRKLYSIGFGLDNEVTVKRDLEKYISVASNSGVLDIWLTTNGTVLNEKKIESYIKSGLTVFSVSVDAATNETYFKLKRKDKLDKVISAIKAIHAYKKSNNLFFPVLRATYYICDENKNEVEDFINLVEEYVDVIDFQDFNDMDKVQNSIFSCYQPFKRMAVYSDGNVAPCCSLFGRKIVLGNAIKDSMYSVWNGETMNKMRSGFLKDEVEALDVCQQCGGTRA